MVAEHDVVIKQEDKQLTGGRAVYTQTNSTLELTDNPAWRAGSRQGKGEVVQLNSQRNQIVVRGNASLILPANELAGQFSPTETGSTNRPAKAGTNQLAQVFCEEYKLRQDFSVFQGGVYATHPEMNCSCEKLTIEMTGTGTTNLLAEQKVVFDLLTQRGKVHGTGDKGLYRFGVASNGTNAPQLVNELRLTGTPAVMTGTNGTFQNSVIIWDRARDKLSLPGGDYKIQGYARAADTNIFALTNKKVTK